MSWEPSNRVDLDPLKQRYYFFVGDFVYAETTSEVYETSRSDSDLRHELDAFATHAFYNRGPIRHRYQDTLEPPEGFGI